MRKIIYLVLLLLVSTMALQAQTKGEIWKTQLDNIRKTTGVESLTLLGYTYLGGVKTEQDFEKLKAKLLSEDNYIPYHPGSDKFTFIKLKDASNEHFIQRYKNYVSRYLDGISQFELGVVELNWKYGDKAFKDYSIVTKNSVVFGHVLTSLFTFEEKTVRIQEIYVTNIPDLEQKMMDFFCQTLKRNFGRADGKSVVAIVEGLSYYKDHYIIEVDKQKLKEINKELFASALTNYFFDRDESNTVHMAMDWKNYDPYQNLICESYLWKPDGNTYYQKELLASKHPFLKQICQEYKYAGGELIPIWFGYMRVNHLGCVDDFVKDRDIRMFTTLIFWRYLCYCANIEFRTGLDKTDVVLEKMGRD